MEPFYIGQNPTYGKVLYNPNVYQRKNTSFSNNSVPSNILGIRDLSRQSFVPSHNFVRSDYPVSGYPGSRYPGSGYPGSRYPGITPLVLVHRRGQRRRPKRKIPKKGWLGYFDKNGIFTKLSKSIYSQFKKWCNGYITYKPQGFETKKDKYMYFYGSQIFIKDWDSDTNMYEHKPLLELFV